MTLEEAEVRIKELEEIAHTKELEIVSERVKVLDEKIKVKELEVKVKAIELEPPTVIEN